MLMRVWMDEWNEIIRHVLFDDKTLMELMKLPEDINIIDFVDKYFIRAGYISTVLKNEPVRIVYGNITTGNPSPFVTINEMSFDIYVKKEYIHNVTKDRLQYRSQLIAQRLFELLTSKAVKDTGYNFWINFEGDKSTSTIGYSRYNITFNYKKTY